MSTEIDSLLASASNVRHGRPCISGTGITVSRIAILHNLGHSIEDIVRKCEHFTPAGVHAALAYSHKTRLFTLTLALVGLLNLIVLPVQSNSTGSTTDVVTKHSMVTENPRQENPRKGGSDLLNSQVSESLARVPLSFQPNVGETYSRVKFMARGDGYNLFLMPTGAVFDLRTKPACGSTRYVDSASPSVRQHPAPCQMADEPTRVRVAMKLVGATPASQLAAQAELPTKVNYFIGNDPKKWRSQIPTYARISHPNVYPGIDLFYYGSQRQLEYDFVVAPGANYRLIRLGFEGATRVEIDRAGDLQLHVKSGVLRQQKPVVYQNIEGRRRKVEGSYILLRRNEVGFKIGDYDLTRPLIIDPVLLYSTYLGGTGFDEALSVAANSSSLFISGSTESVIAFPATTGAYQTSLAGGSDAFVAKLNHTSESAPFFTYITYLGGTGSEHGFGIATDEEDNAYIVGDTTSTNFPTTPGSFRSSPLPSPRYVDSFVTKLNPNGSALIYSTYLGGSRGYDYARDIGVDALGSAYVTGDTTSVDFPLDESGAVRTTPGGFPHHFTDEFDPPDAFVLGLNASGSDLIYTTFLGGPDRRDADRGYGIAVGLGNQFVTGLTSSRVDFPLANAYQSLGGGGLFDAFVTRLEYGSGQLFLRYSTYLGGNNSELGRDIAVDSTGKVYVTGSTDSANFPTRNPLQPVFRGGTCGYSPRFVCHDAFVVKIDPYLSGDSSFLYGSYLGGRSDDLGNGITIDSSNNIYLTGETYSDDFPIRGYIAPDNRPLRSDITGAGDVFITKLNAQDGNTFAYAYSAYLGEYFDALTHIRLSREYGNGVAVDASGNAYVVGQTSSNRFARGSVPYGTYRGNGDAFVAKVQESPLDRIGAMMAMIEQLVKKGLPQDEANNLLVKLEVAMKQLDKGHARPASNQLEAFVARVEKLLQAGLLPSQEGKILIDRAREMINQLNPDLVKPSQK